MNLQPKSYWRDLFATHNFDYGPLHDELLAALADVPEPRYIHENLMVFERVLEFETGSGDTAPGPNSVARRPQIRRDLNLTIAIGSRAWWTRQLVRRLVGAGATLFTIRALPGGSANRVVVAQRSGGRGLTTCRRRGVLTRRDSRTGGAFRGGGRGSHDLCPRPGIRGAGERVGHAGRFHDGGRSRRARREEDREACGLVGAEPRWLPFRGGGYTKERNPDQIWEAATVFRSCRQRPRTRLPADQPRSRVDLRPVHEDDFRRPGSASMPNSRIGTWSSGTALSPSDLPDSTIKRQSNGRAPGQVLPATASSGRRFEPMHRSCLSSDWAQGIHRKLDLMLFHEAFQRGEAIAWVHGETRP